MPSLGASMSGITCGLRDGGCYQLFQNGAILWSATTGAQPSTNGPIRDAWARTGFENGPWATPSAP
ncbi:hypothetical protein ACW0JT_11880 [Arthrobacter sp. SA17]